MKIYTKVGDKGKTVLFGGTSVPKHHVRVEAYGTVDELNAHIGLLSDHLETTVPESLPFLKDVQSNLFVIGTCLATPLKKSNLPLPKLPKEACEHLEKEIDQMTDELEPLRYFILPGGHPVVSVGHVARCVCRRAERCIVRLQESEGALAPGILPYVNRLSDYLFTLVRYAAKKLGVVERPWIPKKEDPKGK